MSDPRHAYEPRESGVLQPRGESAKRRLSSRDLFQHTNEILIDHRGEEYRLRLTRNDKLILNK